MKASLIIIIALLLGMLQAEPRGLTQKEIVIENAVSATQPEAVLYPLGNAYPYSERDYPANPKADQSKESWFNSVSQPLEMMLPAGEQIGLRFVSMDNEAVPFYSLGELIPESVSAVAKSPSWIQSELRNTLAHLTAERQLLFADLINNATDPYVDEIAFSIATSSPEYLNSTFALPQLFLENAQDIYSTATDLPYVEIVDTGSASEGGDYWSTTRYWKKDAGGQLMQVSVPRNIYYWYLVHPNITDEITAYIDPLIVENNNTHSNNIVPPPAGKFWRSYLYDLTDGDYPVMSDTLSLCQTLFNRDGTPGDALHAAMWWINQNMSFTSNSERPHQPVRIIAKRFGRCGEYADLSAAVARTALIPCTSINSVSTDHTWNEFWDEEWVSWEPVNGYVNGPLVYENGWGKVFGSVYEERPDGLMTPVTDRYSEGLATINIQVVDSNMHPVDAARVILAIFETSPRFDCEQYTDNEGMVSFMVGENRDYRARAETFFGLYPANPGTYVQLVSNSVDEETYNYQFVIDADMPLPAIEALESPVDPVDDYRFSANFASTGYYVTGRALWDDIDVLGVMPHYYKKIDLAADASFMVTDSDNVMFFQLDNWCSAYSYLSPVAEGTALFNIPVGQDWYAFADNSHRHGNAVLLSGELNYEYWGTGVDDPQAPPMVFKLSSAAPNPMSIETKLLLELSSLTEISASVYNLRGEKVRSYKPDLLTKGVHTLIWDGRDDNGLRASSGLYIIKVNSEDYSALRKVVLIK